MIECQDVICLDDTVDVKVYSIVEVEVKSRVS